MAYQVERQPVLRRKLKRAGIARGCHGGASCALSGIAFAVQRQEAWLAPIGARLAPQREAKLVEAKERAASVSKSVVSQGSLSRQSKGIDTFMGPRGMASLRDIDSMARSASFGCTGAKPNPQFPIVTDVTPCQLPMVQ